MPCDLHTHSLFSDGTYSPKELIDEAVSKGLSAIALTDHNTASGITEFLEAAKNKPILAIAGTELSCEHVTSHGAVDIHMLALFLPESSYALIEERNADMMRRKKEAYLECERRLAKDGYIINYEELCKKSINLPNRAAIAEELMRRGYVGSIKEAFSSLLASGGKYYHSPSYPSVTETLDFICDIGAVPILAHPFLNLTEDELLSLLPEAKAHGLCGMEVFYSKYDDKTTTRSIEIAKSMGLLQSGGSDFHGSRKPDIALGTGRGNLSVPDDCVNNLLHLKR